MLKSVAFLDRDGVINIDKGYVYKISDFEWIDEAREAIKYLNKENFYVIVISNQSGISRGYYTEKELLILHEFIRKNHVRRDPTGENEECYLRLSEPLSETNMKDYLSLSLSLSLIQ